MEQLPDDVTDWRELAACREEDPELFFPVGHTGPAQVQIAEAKAVCRRCEVRDQCLEWALEVSIDHGVWGGLDEEERRALKRRNARARIRDTSAAEMVTAQIITVQIPNAELALVTESTDELIIEKSQIELLAEKQKTEYDQDVADLLIEELLKDGQLRHKKGYLDPKDIADAYGLHESAVRAIYKRLDRDGKLRDAPKPVTLVRENGRQSAHFQPRTLSVLLPAVAEFARQEHQK